MRGWPTTQMPGFDQEALGDQGGAERFMRSLTQNLPEVRNVDAVEELRLPLYHATAIVEWRRSRMPSNP